MCCLYGTLAHSFWVFNLAAAKLLLCFHSHRKKGLFWYDFSKVVLISFFFHFLCLFKSFVIKLFSWIFHALELSLLFAVLVDFFLVEILFFSFCNARLSTKRPIKLGSSNCITTTVSAIYFCQIFFVGPCKIWNNQLLGIFQHRKVKYM